MILTYLNIFMYMILIINLNFLIFILLENSTIINHFNVIQNNQLIQILIINEIKISLLLFFLIYIIFHNQLFN